MLTDGLQLLNASKAINLTVDGGDVLPTEGNSIGEVFYRTSVEPGLYIFTNDGWSLVSGSKDEGSASSKGTIKVSDGTGLIELPVGANGRILTADSTSPSGIKWGVAPSGGGGSAPAEPDETTYAYTPEGAVETVTETIGDEQRVTVYSYNEAGVIATISTSYLGVTRTETFTYTNGRVTRVIAANS